VLGNFSAYSALKQVYAQMRCYRVKFGILTTYESTWFLKRVLKADGFETLEISEPVPYQSQNPTLFQCLSYFCSVADSEIVSSRTPQLWVSELQREKEIVIVPAAVRWFRRHSYLNFSSTLNFNIEGYLENLAAKYLKLRETRKS
jgi:hypothetical protein